MTHHGAIILMMLCLMLSAPLLTHAETHSGSAPETPAKTALSDADFNEGVRAVREKDYRKAYLIFQQHAESMQPDAQYNLALLLKSGKGSPQNFKQALVWSWLAQLGEVEPAVELVQDLLDMLEEKSVKDARDQVLQRLEDGITKKDRSAVMKIARYYQQVEGEPDMGQAYTWYAVAAALDIEGAAEARDEAFDDVDEADIVDLQEEATTLFDAFVKQ